MKNKTPKCRQLDHCPNSNTEDLTDCLEPTTNFEKISASPEALAEAMIFETVKEVWRFRIGEKVSTQAFRTRCEAKRGAVEYLKQEVSK